MKRLVIRAAALLLATAAAAQPVPDLARFAGTWTVTGVALAPSASAISALVEDDPAYMGATLAITADRIEWHDAGSLAESADDCAGAALADPTEVVVAYDAPEGALAVLCDGRGWGPGAMLVPVDDTRLRLYWYDNGILTLTRGP